MVEFKTKVVIHQGFTYVPIDFFNSFFNEVDVNNALISISPVVYELMNNKEGSDGY
ncbi:hypothetical protein D3C86_1883790 [compost metagenome]